MTTYVLVPDDDPEDDDADDGEDEEEPSTARLRPEIDQPQRSPSDRKFGPDGLPLRFERKAA